jgi:hypothetical protein
MKESLADIFERHAVYGVDAGHGDKGSTHSYIPLYEELLAPFRERCDFMEIGLASGWSMEMWDEYFGPDCSIVGVDLGIIFDRTKFDNRFRFIVTDATKPTLLQALGGRTFDFVIDDASHMEADQISTFLILKERMKQGGIYVIEDILSPESAVPKMIAMHDRVEVHDFRAQKGRYDDMMVVFRF